MGKEVLVVYKINNTTIIIIIQMRKTLNWKMYIHLIRLFFLLILYVNYTRKGRFCLFVNNNNGNYYYYYYSQ